MTDFLDEKRKEIQQRLKELSPLVDEFHRLEEAERALVGVGGTSTSKAATTTAAAPRPAAKKKRGRPARAAKKPAAAKKSTTSTGQRGRPRGSGTRAGQALDLVRANPGITIPELAGKMKIKQNYLYRVMPTLAEQGQIAKSGKGWKAKS